MSRSADGRRVIAAFAAVAGLLTAFTALGYHVIPFAPVGVDDANIFFVYGRNLAEGYGLVWNPGGERVEGYSSITWMLIVSAVTRIGLPLEPSLRAISVMIVSAALTPWLFVASRLLGEASVRQPYAAGLFMAWTLAAPAYVVWSFLSLMDTALWSALLLSIAALLVLECGRPQRRSERWLAAGVSAILLTRPEGMAWGLVFIGLFAAIRWAKGASRGGLARAVAPSGLAYALVAGGMTLFRVVYFGWPLPNMYYAKISPDPAYNLSRGFEYLVGFLGSNWFLWPAALAALAGLVLTLWKVVRGGNGTVRFEDLALGTTSAIVLVALTIPVVVGGDHFFLYRFYQPLWPLYPVPGLILAAYALAAVRRDTSKFPAWGQLGAAAVAASLFFLAPTPRWDELADHDIYRAFELAYIGRQVGTYLNLSFAGAPAPAVGVIATGGFAYGYEGRTIDLMGLNSVAMAHSVGDRRGVRNHAAFNKSVFYELQPDLLLPYVIPSPVDVPRYLHDRWYDLTLNGLLRDELFQARYQTAVIRPREPEVGIYLAAFFRRDFLDWLSDTGNYQILLVKDRRDR